MKSSKSIKFKRNLRNRVCKFKGFNLVRTGDLAKPVRRSNQLNYEATDVENWSFVGSNEPVRNECEVTYEIFHVKPVSRGHGFKHPWNPEFLRLLHTQLHKLRS